MIKKFRVRFIIIMMVLVGIVSLVAFGAIGFKNYQDLKAEVDASLLRATGSDPMGFDDLPALGGVYSDENGHLNNQKSTHSKIPIYSVTVYFGDLGHIIVNSSSTAQMDADVCAAAVEAALAKGQPQGVLSEYGLYYRVDTTLTGYRIAFADMHTVTDGAGNNALVLFAAWLVLMLALFGITIFLSRYVTRPVENAWKEQQRFIADASHELKTPLTIIMADATILAENPDKTIEEQRTWVEGIGAEARRMQQLTEDMLTLAQADAGIDFTQIMSDVDLSSLVEMQVLQFDAVAFERGLVIEDDVDEGLHIIGDALRAENMVKTLLENACKYSAKPGVVNVRLHQVKNEAVLTVHNDGEPVPAEDLPHLFDRFYRSDKARVHEGEAASFGLGLSIAKSTAELHKGTIHVASGADGTTFTVRLPLAKR
jgi:two-component system sensor histidine kinase CiaH